jgi:hypothetical protein
VTKHVDIPVYNRIVQHATLETAILGYLKNPPAYLVPFYDAFKANVLKVRPAIIERLKALENFEGKVETIDFYHMSHKYRFKGLVEQLLAIV